MDCCKLSLSFDATRLQEDLGKVMASSADWIDHYVTQNYEGSWSVIPLRANRGASHPVMMIYSDPVSTDYVDTPFLAASPYFAEVLASFQTKVLAARLMRLGQGSVIKEHRDHDLDVEGGTVRMHIPVVTNPEVHFLLNGRRVIMAEGECWYLRLSDPHAVRNDGPDRVHLVVDMEVNDWVRGQLGVGA